MEWWREYQKLKEEFKEAKAREATARDTAAEESLETTAKETLETTAPETTEATAPDTTAKETPETTALETTAESSRTKARKVRFEEPCGHPDGN